MAMSSLKWEVKKRLEEIDRRLWWTGRLRRADLITRFGISPQQASADIALYKSHVHGNIQFNYSNRCYEPASEFTPSFIHDFVGDYSEWRGDSDAGLEMVPAPLRTTSVPAVRAITLAIHQEKSLQITYQSMSSASVSERRITPHTIVFDGYRYHVRSYCHLKDDFRDFVLGRITEPGNYGSPGLMKEKDDSWNTLVILRLAPHHGLSSSQKKIIERDFGMSNGELHLKVRVAMLHYTLTQLRVDKFSSSRSPKEQQIILLNQDALLHLGDRFKTETIVDDEYGVPDIGV